MDKHAYLIMAHNQFEILEKLLKLIDDKRNDIYIHIDKKAKNVDFEALKKCVTNSRLFFINRTSVQWGAYSQIRCELSLLKASVERRYKYYHLLSGVDLPLKTQDYIHDFFEKNKGLEFVNFEDTHIAPHLRNRYEIFHLFQEKIKRNRKYYLINIIEYIITNLQNKMKINRVKNTNMIFQKGDSWFSITHDLVLHVLDNEKKIKKTFKYTYCCDEIFLQTIVFNSKFLNRLYYNKFDNNTEGCMRYINWRDGTLYNFVEKDYNDLISSNKLFARKFDMSTDKEIINKIYEFVLDQKLV